MEKPTFLSFFRGRYSNVASLGSPAIPPCQSQGLDGDVQLTHNYGTRRAAKRPAGSGGVGDGSGCYESASTTSAPYTAAASSAPPCETAQAAALRAVATDGGVCVARGPVKRLSELVAGCLSLTGTLLLTSENSTAQPTASTTALKHDRTLSARLALERRGRRTTSKLRGVTHHLRSERWEAHMWQCGKQIYLGSFFNEAMAGLAHDLASLHSRGDEARTNYVLSGPPFDAFKAARSMFSQEEMITSLRSYIKTLQGASTHSSMHRGVLRTASGGWEARVGQVPSRRSRADNVRSPDNDGVPNSHLAAGGGSSDCATGIPSDDEYEDRSRRKVARRSLQTRGGLTCTGGSSSRGRSSTPHSHIVSVAHSEQPFEVQALSTSNSVYAVPAADTSAANVHVMQGTTPCLISAEQSATATTATTPAVTGLDYATTSMPPDATFDIGHTLTHGGDMERDSVRDRRQQQQPATFNLFDFLFESETQPVHAAPTASDAFLTTALAETSVSAYTTTPVQQPTTSGEPQRWSTMWQNTTDFREKAETALAPMSGGNRATGHTQRSHASPDPMSGMEIFGVPYCSTVSLGGCGGGGIQAIMQPWSRGQVDGSAILTEPRYSWCEDDCAINDILRVWGAHSDIVTNRVHAVPPPSPATSLRRGCEATNAFR